MQQIEFRRTADAPPRQAPHPEVVRRSVERTPAEERRLWHAALAIVLAAAAVRLVMAAASPLVPDEAYYWEWSRRLAAGYFDHPPAIALLIRPGTEIFGATALGVRFFPVLAGLATILLVVDLARRHGGVQAALYAAVISACVPLAAAGLVLATPDTPLLLAYALVLSALDRALAAPVRSRASFGWWLAAGAALGMGFASKYTMVLLPLGVLLAFLLRGSLRGRLRTPEPYFAAAVAFLVFFPVVFWNARHEWASFAFQFGRGLGSAGGSALARELELLGNQLALISPILFGMLALAVIGSLKNRVHDRRYLLAMVAATTFAFFVYHSLRHRPEPNWPAPAYLSGFVLLSLAIVGSTWKRWLRAGCMLGAVMIVLLYVQALHPVLPVPPRKDPMARGYGWTTLAQAVQASLPPAASGDRTAWVATNRYQDAAQLAFHLPGNPVVFSLNLASRPNQYDFWPGFVERARPGDRLVLVLEDSDAGEGVIRLLNPHFDEVQIGAPVEMRRGGGLLGQRRIWHLEGWRGTWPEKQ
jgi:4-amino-4-deoxy-L-arabinose transferase-like glycosyltransferase